MVPVTQIFVTEFMFWRRRTINVSVVVAALVVPPIILPRVSIVNMWSRIALSTVSRCGYGAVVGRRSFAASSSLQKRALKALGNKPATETEIKDNTFINNDALEENRPIFKQIQHDLNSEHENDVMDGFENETVAHVEKVVPEEESPTPPPVSSPKPIMVAPPGQLHEFAPRIVVVGVGGGGGNAINNMISKELQGTRLDVVVTLATPYSNMAMLEYRKLTHSHLYYTGVDFLALNTDAQHLSTTLTDQRLQLGVELTRGLGCGANPDAGRMAAEECREAITELLREAHMVFITAGMGGGTGTGAAPVVAEICYELDILTVAVVTLPFAFEGTHRKRLALEGIGRLQDVVDTLIVIPNQNLFQLATPDTSFVDAFSMADNVLLGGVKSITDLMTSPGLINLDFADVQSVMHGMGNALLGTGLASGEDRAVEAAKMALDNPLLGSDMDISTAKGMLVNITGGKDMTLFEVDKAAQCVTERVKDESANIIFGSAYDEALEGSVRVSVVATGIDQPPHM